MDLHYDAGPHKKRLEPKEQTVPTVYIMPNLRMSPLINDFNRPADTSEIKKPIQIMMAQPLILVLRVREGHKLLLGVALSTTFAPKPYNSDLLSLGPSLLASPPPNNLTMFLE